MWSGQTDNYFLADWSVAWQIFDKAWSSIVTIFLEEFDRFTLVFFNCGRTAYAALILHTMNDKAESMDSTDTHMTTIGAEKAVRQVPEVDDVIAFLMESCRHT